MKVRDFWEDLHFLFEGESERIQEIDLINLKAGSMAECLHYLFSRAKECNCRFVLPGTETPIHLQSPQAVVNHVLQGQVSIVMWVSLPAIPMLSVFVDYTDEISFGYVRGSWNALTVLAFFDLIYELSQMSPGANIRPSNHTFSPVEREALLTFWQDYNHAVS